MLLLGMGVLKGARQMIDRALRATCHTRTGMIGEATALVGIAALGPMGAIVGGLEGIATAAAVSQAIALVVVLDLAKRQMSVPFVDLWPFQKAALSDLSAFMGKAKVPSAAI